MELACFDFLISTNQYEVCLTNEILLYTLFLIFFSLQLIPFLKRYYINRFIGECIVNFLIVISCGSIILLVMYDNEAGEITIITDVLFNSIILLICSYNTFYYSQTEKYNIHQNWKIRLFAIMCPKWFILLFQNINIYYECDNELLNFYFTTYSKYFNLPIALIMAEIVIKICNCI